MLIFAIPLKGKASCYNWDIVQDNFNNTIESVFNQKGSRNFKCIVACTDIPELRREYDDRLELLQFDLPKPNSHKDGVKDKWYKLTAIAKRARDILLQSDRPEEGLYFMPLDADDLISNRIAKHCDDNPFENGFISEYGFVHHANTRYLIKYKDLYTYCGSCNVIKIFEEGLPTTLPPFDEFEYNPERYIFHISHPWIPQESEKRGGVY